MYIKSNVSLGIAGVVSGHPFDTIKVRLQSQDSHKPLYRGTLHCAQSIVRDEGFRGLFKGMASPIIGVAVVNSLLFGVYGGLLEYQMQSSPLPEDGSPRQPTLLQIFIAGSLSGVVNAFVSSPIELVKIRMQNQGVNALHPTGDAPVTTPSTINAASKPMGPLQCTRHIWRTEGLRGVYRGLPVTLIRETPSYGMYFMSYELLCRTLAPEGTDPKELSGVRLMLAGNNLII